MTVRGQSFQQGYALMTRHTSATAAFCVLFLAGAMAIRPTYLGETYAPVGTALMMIAALGAWLLPGQRVQLKRRYAEQAFATASMWLLLTVHSVLMGTQNYYGLAATALVSAAVFSATILFSIEGCEKRFAAYFRVMLCVLSLSFLVTTFLTLVLRIPLYSLDLAKLYSKTYGDSGDVLFPFTLVYEWKQYDFGLFIRPNAFFRESGIAQAFYAWAILSLPYVKSTRNRVEYWLLVAGGLSAQSTIGFATIGAAIFVRYARQSKADVNALVLFPFFAAAALLLSYFAITDDQLGLASKVQTDSYADRSIGLADGLQSFLDNPIGYGVYNDTGGNHTGINLISSVGALGMPGIILVAAQFAVVVLSAKDRIGKLMLVFPIVVTELFSQPLLDAALVYVVFMIEPPPTVAAKKRSSGL